LQKPLGVQRLGCTFIFQCFRQNRKQRHTRNTEITRFTTALNQKINTQALLTWHRRNRNALLNTVNDKQWQNQIFAREFGFANHAANRSCTPVAPRPLAKLARLAFCLVFCGRRERVHAVTFFILCPNTKGDLA
jgi:hypothetical protein